MARPSSSTPKKPGKSKQRNSSSSQNANANGQQTGIDDFAKRQIAGNNVFLRFKMGSGPAPKTVSLRMQIM